MAKISVVTEKNTDLCQLFTDRLYLVVCGGD